ncbi:hypothetical protein HN51_055525 [Arachis hypogaea]|uniref:uncharacterized protein LOC110267232 n=1 Tax=Arachis ipaensis TaxID=130454 RepID=UPI000A2B3C61|nr:uncharacterized protein LOC110267232 [Arachis ipaensis]
MINRTKSLEMSLFRQRNFGLRSGSNGEQLNDSGSLWHCASRRRWSSTALHFSTTLVLYSAKLLNDSGPLRRYAFRRIWSSMVLHFSMIMLLYGAALLDDVGHNLCFLPL